jgi:branched-chain amino acid transport system substrate-binding protein
MNGRRRHFLKTAGAAAAVAGAAPWVLRHARAQEPINVAMLMDLTGILDFFGVSINECFTLAVEETNAAGGLLGRPVNVITYDTQTNNQLYAQYAQRAATQDNVTVVHGGLTSAAREVVRPILKRFETLYFYNQNYEGGVCDRNCFLPGTTPGHSVKALVDYALKNKGKRFYTVAADYNYGQILSAWAKKYAQEAGGEVIQEDFFPLEVTDFGSTISKIQAAKPDFLFWVLVGTNHLGFIRQWAAAGMTDQIPIVSPVFAAGQELSMLPPEQTEGITVCYSYIESLDTPENIAFREKFRTRFNRPEGYLNDNAVDAYIGWKLYAKAVEMAGTTDRMKVIEALESGPTIDAPQGKIVVDGPTHHCFKDVSVAVVRNNTLDVLETHSQLRSEVAAFCDLVANPDDDQQYQPDL